MAHIGPTLVDQLTFLCVVSYCPFDLAVLRNYHNGKKCDKAKWKQARKLADDIFLKGMEASDPKVPAWKKYAAYYAVRCFGWGPASAKGQDKFGL